MIVNGYDINLYTEVGASITFNVLTNGVNYTFDAQEDDFYYSVVYRASVDIGLYDISVDINSVYRITIEKNNELLFEGIAVKEDITQEDNLNYDSKVYNIAFTDYLSELDKIHITNPNRFLFTNPNTGATDWRYRNVTFTQLLSIPAQEIDNTISINYSMIPTTLQNSFNNELLCTKVYIDDNSTFLEAIEDHLSMYRCSVFIKGKTIYVFEVNDDTKINKTFLSSNTFDEVEKIVLPNTVYELVNQSSDNDNIVYCGEAR